MSFRRWVIALFALAAILVLLFFFVRPATAQPRESAQRGDSLVVRGTGNSGLNVRTGAGASFPILGVLSEGATVQNIEGPRSAEDDNWYRVEGRATNGAPLVGWAVGRYLLTGPVVLAGGGRTFMAEVRAYTVGGDAGTTTATGTAVRWGTVAVDPAHVPLGSLLAIEGLDSVFVAEDVGGTIRGAQLDVWFPNHESALRWGAQRRQVTVLREGY
jgi:3D (Asp-Asp-Asp) domain-containing protein